MYRKINSSARCHLASTDFRDKHTPKISFDILFLTLIDSVISFTVFSSDSLASRHSWDPHMSQGMVGVALGQVLEQVVCQGWC